MNIVVTPIGKNLYMASLDNRIFTSGYSITDAIGKLVWGAAKQLELNINIKGTIQEEGYTLKNITSDRFIALPSNHAQLRFGVFDLTLDRWVLFSETKEWARASAYLLNTNSNEVPKS